MATPPRLTALLRGADAAIRGVVLVVHSAAMASSSALRPIRVDVARDGRSPGGAA